MELAKLQCYESECFEDNYSLTISTQVARRDVGLTQGLTQGSSLSLEL